MSKPTFAYWNVRGLGQPIRLLLSYLGIDFVNKEYDTDESWFSQKFTIGLDFPNLPYYIDGDVKLTQSMAILGYLGRKHNLYGSSDEEKRRIDVLENQIADLIHAFYETALEENYQELKHKYIDDLKPKLQELAKFIGNGPYANGNSISYVDFLLYEYLVRILLFVPELFAQFVALQSFVKRIESLPNVAKFIEKRGKLQLIGYPDKWDAEY